MKTKIGVVAGLVCVFAAALNTYTIEGQVLAGEDVIISGKTI
jgi:ABC-type spermidine/putrescine transport system permease subunit I